jgi:hypothetical protein
MDYKDFIVCLCRKMIIVQRKLLLITRHSVGMSNKTRIIRILTLVTTTYDKINLREYNNSLIRNDKNKNSSNIRNVHMYLIFSNNFASACIFPSSRMVLFTRRRRGVDSIRKSPVDTELLLEKGLF